LPLVAHARSASGCFSGGLDSRQEQSDQDPDDRDDDEEFDQCKATLAGRWFAVDHRRGPMIEKEVAKKRLDVCYQKSQIDQFRFRKNIAKRVGV
jgi:hypothetical protein